MKTMKNCIQLALVFSATLAVPVVNAAIDDAGMRYVSASEGFGGSLRVNLLQDTNAANEGVQTTLGSTRLYVTGNVDLGDGLSSIYYWEWRTGDDKAVTTDSVYAGLEGPFGELRAGIVEPVVKALIPSSDLTNDVGVGEEDLFGTSVNVVRWTSPDINGLMFGGAAQMKDNVGDDDVFDAYDVAAVYTMPLGLKIGGGYSKVTHTRSGVLSKKFNISGYRTGIRYGQDNWQVGYNYRNFDDFFPLERVYTAEGYPKLPEIDPAMYPNYPISARNYEARLEQHERKLAFYGENFRRGADYQSHAFGANAVFDKFTVAVGFQKEQLKAPAYTDLERHFQTIQLPPASTLSPVEAFSLAKIDGDVNTYTVDAGYSLGSHSKIVAAYKLQDYGSVREPLQPPSGSDAPRLPAKESKIYLLYRVDF